MFLECAMFWLPNAVAAHFNNNPASTQPSTMNGGFRQTHLWEFSTETARGCWKYMLFKVTVNYSSTKRLLIYQNESEASLLAFTDIIRRIILSVGQFYWISPPPAPWYLQLIKEGNEIVREQEPACWVEKYKCVWKNESYFELGCMT